MITDSKVLGISMEKMAAKQVDLEIFNLWLESRENDNLTTNLGHSDSNYVHFSSWHGRNANKISLKKDVGQEDFLRPQDPQDCRRKTEGRLAPVSPCPSRDGAK